MSPPVASRGSEAGELTVGLDVHVAVFVRSRRIRHFVPTTGGPAPQEPHQAADRRHPGGDHRRPHQYLSQPEAPLDLYDPPLRMPKSGQLVHAPRNAHDQLDENGRHGPRACPGDSANYRAWSAARRERPLAYPLVAGSSPARPLNSVYCLGRCLTFRFRLMPDSVSADSLNLLRLTASERIRLLRRVPRGVEIYRAPQQILTDNGKVFTGRFHHPGGGAL
jgi:hypothetical protein